MFPPPFPSKSAFIRRRGVRYKRIIRGAERVVTDLLRHKRHVRRKINKLFRAANRRSGSVNRYVQLNHLQMPNLLKAEETQHLLRRTAEDNGALIRQKFNLPQAEPYISPDLPSECGQDKGIWKIPPPKVGLRKSQRQTSRASSNTANANVPMQRRAQRRRKKGDATENGIAASCDYSSFTAC